MPLDDSVASPHGQDTAPVPAAEPGAAPDAGTAQEPIPPSAPDAPVGPGTSPEPGPAPAHTSVGGQVVSAEEVLAARAATASPAARPARLPLVRRVLSVILQLVRIVLGGLDGLALGFAIGYVSFTALAGPSKRLGYGIVVDVLAPTVAAMAVIVAGLLIIGGPIVVLRRFARALDRWLAAGRVGPRARIVLVLPFRALGALPARTLALVAASLVMAFVLRFWGPFGFALPSAAHAVFLYAAAVVGFCVGLAWASLRVPTGGRVGFGRAALAGLGGLFAVAVVGASVVVAIDPGSDAHLVRPDPAFEGIAIATDLPDPGLPGQYAVRTFSYGSGTDAHRPAFGPDAAVKTPTVDASAALDPLENDGSVAWRWFWGFDTNALPLNGLVWYPQGDGPFPLALIVHGNHAAGDFSEPGYAYLGRQLASLGIITVSVDEDFLNGAWYGDWKGSEQPVRAYLLLRHLDLWRTWNADPSSPFVGQVDLDRVALMGHSRGGEAASIAASWTSLATPPAPGLTPWPKGLKVRAVVSIAPSDNQYNPAGVNLDGVDFLTMSGGHDGDAIAWSGIRQYARTTLRPGGFKAAIWAYRDNHGQYNTVWGNEDQGPFSSWLLATKPLMDGPSQEDVARTAIGAFLEASLFDADGYRAFFRRPMVGRAWLPDDIYLVRSMDDRFQPLVDTAKGPEPTVPSITLASDGFAATGVIEMPLRGLQGDQDMEVAILRWSSGSGWATWRLNGLDAAASDAGTELSGASEIRFALANAIGDQVDDPAGLDPLIELTSTDGVKVELLLDRWGAVPPPLPSRVMKNDLLADLGGFGIKMETPVERVLQTYAIPLADFAAADRTFDPAHLASVAIRFDRKTAGAAYLGEVGIAP